jgi:hypothetical protein
VSTPVENFVIIGWFKEIRILIRKNLSILRDFKVLFFEWGYRRVKIVAGGGVA